MKLQVVGGGGGWDKQVTAQGFHNDAGVSSTRVLNATASQVGETVNDVTPTTLGVDWVRSLGPASRVFAERDWYVDLTGVTQFASRAVATPDDTFEVLDFDPKTQALKATSDVVLQPGLQVADSATTPRWDGTLTVRDIEQVFNSQGSRATLWCSSVGVSRLSSALTNMVRELGRLQSVRTYRYRFVTATGKRLNLQAVNKVDGIPDILPISVWPGMAGLSAVYAPGQQVIVEFLEGDLSQPVVRSFDGNLPSEVSLDANDKVHIAPSGGTPAPLARLGDPISVVFGETPVPLSGMLSGIVTPPSGPPFPVSGPFVGATTTPLPTCPGVIIGGSGKADCG